MILNDRKASATQNSANAFLPCSGQIEKGLAGYSSTL